MILRALGLLLLLTGSVEAGESIEITNANVFGEMSTSKGPIATCDLDYTHCEVLEPEAFPCYQRMQEWLAEHNGIDILIDGEKHRVITLDGQQVEQQEQLMRDCVKETP